MKRCNRSAPPRWNQVQRRTPMSTPRPDAEQTPAAPGPPPASRAVPLRFTQTDSFVALLHQLGASLLVTTYQAQQLLVLRADGAGLSMLVRTFDKPMGLAVADRR